MGARSHFSFIEAGKGGIGLSTFEVGPNLRKIII